ncbi:ABC transporter ATP-binding protein [Jiangella ureilytica]|uniref:ABC transporter ATP-binding protein n=2 Tax=Jiangella ureilytica TaxID=2530374 RepID=A0A4R4RQL6_9ACTN|nr:ABC transporter ATP-binding protein [Jiangella ureilytica]TDC52187.1 ABC transporter ATP-binding protein [Jiangella ureilytica]
MTAPAVRLDAVTKIYGSGDNRVTALREVGADLATGTFTAIMGPSGSGKSTFLQCAAGLDRPTSGSVRLGDTELSTLSDNELTVVRRDRIGFVFQAYNLLSSLSVEDNVSLPLRLAGRRIDPDWIARVAGSVGLGEHLQRRPAQLSGGQQQRVAIARALVTEPDAVFADEPTGALDTRTGRQVLELLRRVVDESGQTVVMVTHDPVAASFADRVLFLADGRITGVVDAPTAELVAERMTKLGAW